MNDGTEHFVTLFDKNFLVLGLALYKSLLRHAGDFKLWVVCMDDQVEVKLRQLNFKRIGIISLRTVETTELLEVKNTRSAGEYCWTLTPFTITAAFSQDTNIQRITYLDADVFFFGNPKIFIKEMLDAKKHVLITEHGYAPQYDQTKRSGRFCVQFMTFNRSEPSMKVYKWWQDRCLEWCFNRFENGKFGDQKYLDSWPELFASEVHILKQLNEALGPWNVKMRLQSQKRPIMYHFHGFRFMSSSQIRLSDGYNLSPVSMDLYYQYCREITEIVEENPTLQSFVPLEAQTSKLKPKLGKLWRKLTGRRHEFKIIRPFNDH